MAHVNLFDVPIYWCEEAKFWSNYDAKLAAHLSRFESDTGYPLSDNLRLSLTESFSRNFIAPWEFNQIVGWVRLYKLGSQLRGELWYMNAKCPGRQLVKKQFSDQGKAFEMHTWPHQSSNDIYHDLLHELRQFSNQGHRKYVLDLREFEAVGPFVDWRAIIYGNQSV